jgi:hypothetical protein
MKDVLLKFFIFLPSGNYKPADKLKNFSKTSFIGYINNVMIKSPIYFISNMHITRQIMGIISERFRVFMFTVNWSCELMPRGTQYKIM